MALEKEWERELEIEGGRVNVRLNKKDAVILSCHVNSSRVKIPDYIDGLPVTVLYKKAFLSSKQLKEVWLPAKLKEMGDWAFAYCSSLENVWLPAENLSFSIGKGVFKECGRLVSIAPRGASAADKQVGKLLGAVPVRLEADYLFTPEQAGGKEWLMHFDDKLKDFLRQPDEDGFVKMVYCGEEDIVANVEFFLAERKREKSRLCYLRLINDVGLSDGFREELREYLAGHTKGCPSEAAWEVVLKEHGNEQDYYAAFIDAGCLTEENYDAILSQMGGDYPEMKGYLLRHKSQNMGDIDFFGALSLD